MRKVFAVLRMLMVNPINRKHRIAALARFFKWQLGSWLVPGKVLIPWINGSRIFAGFMMSGSAGCAYSGLHEFEEMAFVLHCLRKDDLFMDVGANVGVFTVLAASAVGSRCVALEPGDEAFAHLGDNVVINRIQDRVKAVKACISDTDGVCRFSVSEESTWSHVATGGEDSATDIETLRIDTVLGGEVPLIMKIDVEGYEKQAIEGASQTFTNEGLKAVILEIGSHSLRYGVEPAEIHQLMLGYGFHPYVYDPFTRSIESLGTYSQKDNTLYLRDVEFVNDRLQNGTSFTVFGLEL